MDSDIMTLEEVADEVLGLIVGGHETTSTAMTWTLFELQRHPDIQEEVVGSDPCASSQLVSPSLMENFRIRV